MGLIRRLGMEAVLRMSFLGGSERMSAERAHQLGLVGDVVPAEQLLPRARELASKIAAHSPAALAGSRSAPSGRASNRGLDDSLAHAWDIISEHTGHPDSREGPTAFAERREPAWQPLRQAQLPRARTAPGLRPDPLSRPAPMGYFVYLTDRQILRPEPRRKLTGVATGLAGAVVQQRSAAMERRGPSPAPDDRNCPKGNLETTATRGRRTHPVNGGIFCV